MNWLKRTIHSRIRQHYVGEPWRWNKWHAWGSKLHRAEEPAPVDSEISVEVREVDDLIVAEAVIVCNSISETLFWSFVWTYGELLFLASPTGAALVGLWAGLTPIAVVLDYWKNII